MNDNMDFFLNNFEKTKKISIIVLSVISFFEIGMMVFGLLSFDFSNIRYVGYFASYIFLLLFSIVTLIIIVINYNMVNEHKKLLRGVTITYEIAIIIWSIFISALDNANGSYPIVFLTVIFVVPFIFVVNPIYLCISSIVGTIIVCTTFAFYQAGDLYSYLINVLIACALNLIVINRAYYAMRKEYLYEKSLLDLSFKDQLTGINNRRAFDDKLSQIEGSNEYILVMLDLDDFKLVNDKLGHKKGDEFLWYTAEIIKGMFGDDSVYRYGGDEFAIITKYDLNSVIEKLDYVNAAIKEKDLSMKTLGISAGVLKISESTKKRDFIVRADNSLYKAKTTGKSKIIVYEDYNI